MIGMSDNNQAFLVNGVIWVEESNRQVIIKHRGGFEKPEMSEVCN